ncbi:fructosamine kinase family protein [Aliiroseovarius sp. PTFE2010]|uniref:fructosamine kinase family protein n=1 Tax=Aliiroseovarius sp. PTFE2010 TaxID=3417190 RepID=UPI003CF57181
MNIAAALKDLGIASRRITSLSGGALSDVYRVDTSRAVFAAKTGPHVAVEARMLRAMAAAGAPVPRVINEAPNLILLEFLHDAPCGHDSWEAAGAALRDMHATTGDASGWPEDYAFGAVDVVNTPCSDWPEFWAERRLRPFAQTFPDLAPRIDTACQRLRGILPDQACGLLHGDMWSGNLLATTRGVMMIDPACYHGHGEVDLAMLDLFSEVPPALAAGYGPLEPGWQERRRIYQIFPALVHLALFGGSYRNLVDRLLPT